MMQETSEYGMNRKSLSRYVVGLSLTLVMMSLSFGVVAFAGLSHVWINLILAVSAIAQFFIQAIYFLGLSFKDDAGKLNVYSFIFTGIVLAIMVGGSIWIMYQLNYNMMH